MVASRLIADIFYQRGHQLVPLVAGQLNGRDGGDDLSGGVASLWVGRRQRLQRQLLYTVLCLIVGLLEPLGLKLLVTSVVSGSESVFQGDTSSSSDSTVGLFVCEFLNEGGKV